MNVSKLNANQMQVLKGLRLCHVTHDGAVASNPFVLPALAGDARQSSFDAPVSFVNSVATAE